MAPTKDELVAEAQAAGYDVDGSETKADLEALLGGNADADAERHCPHCGELHASSLVPESEMHHLENQGVKLSALPKADVYRVFICEDRFYPVPHEEGDAA